MFYFRKFSNDIFQVLLTKVYAVNDKTASNFSSSTMSIPSIEKSIAYYLGIKAVRSNYHLNGILCGGNHCINYVQFENQAEADAYHHDTQYKIRDQEEAINNAWLWHCINDEERDNRFRNHLLPKVATFIEKWSKEMVPEDILVAVTDIKSNVGVAITIWPPWECIQYGHIIEEVAVLQTGMY